MKFVKIFLSLVAALLATACASNIQQNVNQPVELQSGKVQTIYLVISGRPAITQDGSYLQSVEELRNGIREELQKSMPSANLVHGKAPEVGIKANLMIEDFRYVSGAARFMTGIMVGKARLQVRVELTDLSTGKKIGESAFGTSSSTSEGIFGGTTSRQLEAMAVSVATMLGSTAK